MGAEMHDNIFDFRVFINFTKFFKNPKAVFLKFSMKLTTYIVSYKWITTDWFIYSLEINFNQVQMYIVNSQGDNTHFLLFHILTVRCLGINEIFSSIFTLRKFHKTLHI